MTEILVFIFRFVWTCVCINITLICLTSMYPKFMTKISVYIQVFAMTTLMAIGWFAHFGSIGKFIKWKIEGVEYEIVFPRIGGDEIE